MCIGGLISSFEKFLKISLYQLHWSFGHDRCKLTWTCERLYYRKYKMCHKNYWHTLQNMATNNNFRDV